MRYIYRQEYPDRRIVGWQVLYARGLQKKISCFFSDQAYGGKEEALAAAKDFRDKLLELHAPPEPSKPPLASRFLRVANKPAELIGMRIALAGKLIGGMPAYNWTGYARVDGKLKNRAWSITKWGYETAFWNAAKHRQSLTGQPLPSAVPAPTNEILEWAAQLEKQGIHVFGR